MAVLLKYRRRRRLGMLAIALIAALIVLVDDYASATSTARHLTNLSQSALEKSTAQFPTRSLPSPQPHPLPPTLARSPDNANHGDYFAQVKPTSVGYLVWSQFPVKVYIANPAPEILQAVHEWNVYLPLVVVAQPAGADIQIMRSRPRLQITANNFRARSAETSYEIYVRNRTLLHRCTIILNPSQTGKHLLAAARHELGHALGIWGHSPHPSDALYFTQIRNPVPISPRDLNTLRRVYQQPTSLGWSISSRSARIN